MKLSTKLTKIASILKYPKLYHATYKPFLKSIISKGLGATKQTLWEDSVPGVVYLAIDPYVAESYAETADVEEELLDQIVILEIDTSYLDINKLNIDKNVIDNQGDTLEYHGIIPPEAISIFES